MNIRVRSRQLDGYRYCEKCNRMVDDAWLVVTEDATHVYCTKHAPSVGKLADLRKELTETKASMGIAIYEAIVHGDEEEYEGMLSALKDLREKLEEEHK